MSRLHARALGGALSLTLLAACSHEAPEQEKRRAVLTPVDLASTRREAIDKLRFLDEAGNLLPSDIKVAGVLMPRGVTLTSSYPHEWHYCGELPVAKVEVYFRARLDIAAEAHPNPSRLELYRAKPKGEPNAPGATFRIYPQPGHLDEACVFIDEGRPPPSYYPTEAEVNAQMSARREHAE